ncbi:hypothetical protein ACLKA7_005599, partial [Drosophila subpalustris]
LGSHQDAQPDIWLLKLDELQDAQPDIWLLKLDVLQDAGCSSDRFKRLSL